MKRVLCFSGPHFFKGRIVREENIDFGIHNERQDCKIGTVGGTCGRGK
jgi:hypothetical protein